MAVGSHPDIVVIYDGVISTVPDPLPDGEDLWLTPPALQHATGFFLNPEGACRGEICVPLPDAKRHAFFRTVNGQSYFNLSALAHELEQPIVRAAAHSLWAFGASPTFQRSVLETLEAPNVTLPDWKGTIRSLAEFRGRKVLLLTWASW